MRLTHLRPPHFLATWILAISLPALTLWQSPHPPAPTPGVALEEYMAARVKRDHFSGSILIAREGKVLFSKGYGMANLEHDVPKPRRPSTVWARSPSSSPPWPS